MAIIPIALEALFDAEVAAAIVADEVAGWTAASGTTVMYDSSITEASFYSENTSFWEMVQVAFSPEAWAAGATKYKLFKELKSGYLYDRSNDLKPKKVPRYRRDSAVRRYMVPRFSYDSNTSKYVIPISSFSVRTAVALFNYMQIPVELKGAPTHLAPHYSGGKKTPRVIKELFPPYFESVEKNLFSAEASSNDFQGVLCHSGLTRAGLDDIFTKSAATAAQDKASALADTVDYLALGRTLLGTLGYPYAQYTIASSNSRSHDLGLWYTFREKLTYFNPGSVPAYVEVHVHSHKVVGATAGAAQAPINQTPLAWYTAYSDTNSEQRFYNSATFGSGAGNTGDHALNETSEYIGIIGKRLTNSNVTKFFPIVNKYKFILPSMGTFTCVIDKPMSYYDACAVFYGDTYGKEAYHVVTYWHGPYAFSDGAAAAQDKDNWGRMTASLSCKTKFSIRANLHTDKISLGQKLRSNDLLIPAGKETVINADALLKQNPEEDSNTG